LPVEEIEKKKRIGRREKGARRGTPLSKQGEKGERKPSKSLMPLPGVAGTIFGDSSLHGKQKKLWGREGST